MIKVTARRAQEKKTPKASVKAREEAAIKIQSVSRQYEAKKRVAELKKQETVPNLRITSSTRVPADDAGSSFRGKHFQATAPRIGKGSTNIGAAKVSRSTRNDEVKQTSLPNKSSPRRKGPNRGVSDNPVTVISPALTEMLRQLHNRLDENAQLVEYLRGQNAELVNELQELRQQGAQPPGAALNVAWEHECYALREELAKAELDRDAYSAALAASGSGKEGAERLAKFVTDKLSTVAAERDDALAELADLQERMDEAFEERRSARSKGNGAATPAAATAAAPSDHRQSGEEQRYGGGKMQEGDMVRHSSESTRSNTSNDGSQEGEATGSRKNNGRSTRKVTASRKAESSTRSGSGDYASGAGLSTRGPQKRPAR